MIAARLKSSEFAIGTRNCCPPGRSGDQDM